MRRSARSTTACTRIARLRLSTTLSRIPLKAIGGGIVTVADVGQARDAQQIQNNVVRVDGQPSVYLPVLKQGGDTNTISVVDGIRERGEQTGGYSRTIGGRRRLRPVRLSSRQAIETLVHEGALGLVMTALDDSHLPGELPRHPRRVPLDSAFGTGHLPDHLGGGGTIDTMVLGGLALVFSRVIDNSVVVLENIYRHLELGLAPAKAAETGRT